MKDEGWASRDDSPNWGCLVIAAILAAIWLAVLVRLGVF